MGLKKIPCCTMLCRVGSKTDRHGPNVIVRGPCTVPERGLKAARLFYTLNKQSLK